MAGVAAIAALLLYVLAKIFLGGPAYFVAAFGAPGLCALWFFTRARRAPTLEERNSFLRWYAVFIGTPMLLAVLSAWLQGILSLFGVLMTAFYFLVYLAAAQQALSEKRMRMFMRKESAPQQRPAARPAPVEDFRDTVPFERP